MRIRPLIALGASLVAGWAVSCGSAGDDAEAPPDGRESGADPRDATPEGTSVARPSNKTCTAPPRPPVAAAGGVTFVKAFPNLQVELSGEGTAIYLQRARFGTTGPTRWFVVQRDGRVWTFVDPKASKTGVAADGVTPVEKAELFLETHKSITVAGESGLLSVALDPDFGLDDASTYAYLHFSYEMNNEVWRYHIKRVAGAWVVDEKASIMQVRTGGVNHFGGEMKFGPDGYLYLALGDGGLGFDPYEPTKTNRLRGKILRVDPRGKTAYGIPTDNPYRLAADGSPNPSCNDQDLTARAEPCPEIFAKGLRNPFRGSFDRETHRLWIGDVGYASKEEIDLVERGQDYGWYGCEGDGPLASCPPTTAGTGLTAPVAQFRITDFQTSTSVIGGVVYRGLQLPAIYRGAYLFGEIYSGEIYVIDQPYKNVVDAPFEVKTIFEHPDQAETSYPRFRKLGIAVPGVTSFNEDENGELYLTIFDPTAGGAVLKMVPSAAAPPDTIPTRLSATGCVDPAAPAQPAPGVVPYEINAPFWSDGAEKERFVAIPDDAKLDVLADGRIELPKGGVAMKHFRLGGKLVETRLFVRHTDGGYAGYNYVWQDDGKDAVLANAQGERRVFGGQAWIYPSRAQCLTCHNAAAGNTLGLELRQLHRGTQLDDLSRMALFGAPIDTAKVVPIDDPFGAADVDRRARAYLHANCSMCHRADARPDLRLGAPNAHLCDAPALVVPGQPDSSPLFTRLADPNRVLRMPRGGGGVIDTKGVALLREWIASRSGCP
ncbi:MAG TPA: PQQ-dependent sugar dehydrogenase [Labilithrix sp.]|nr:PQQ-dependent sugar dehydrogenase [Labilithrix sp.]